MYRFILLFYLFIGLVGYCYSQAPIIIDGPATFIVNPSNASKIINYTNNSYVYRASGEIQLLPGFEVTQTGNTTSKYFLAYINTPNTSGIYAELKEEQDDSYCLALNAVLTFKYDEKYFVNASAPLNFVIYNYKMQTMACPALLKQYGPNYFMLDLIGYDFIQNQYYIIVVTNEKGEKKFLRFKYFQRNN